MILDNFKEKLKNIKAIVFDIDGVFSNNIILNADGNLLRTLNVKDCFAIKHAAYKHSFIVGIITRGDFTFIKDKLKLLGVTDIYLKSYNKLDDFKNFTQKHKLQADQVMYMGYDIPDYEIMKVVGIPSCPADAAEEIKALSVYISDKKGGEGCVRDIVEQILRAQTKWVKLK